MNVVNPWIEIEDFDNEKFLRNIELATRTCYRSEDKITKDSYKILLKNCISRGHESILEHEKITVRMYVDLSFYKDVTRHRHASFSIESTRYNLYSKDKFGGELTFIKPIFSHHKNDSSISILEKQRIWENTMQNIEDNYMKMQSTGAPPDECRMLLPHSIAAMVVMTANLREWKHIFSLRASRMSHPSVQQVMIPLLLHFKEKMPEIFDSVDYNKDFDKNLYAELKIIK